EPHIQYAFRELDSRPRVNRQFQILDHGNAVWKVAKIPIGQSEALPLLRGAGPICGTGFWGGLDFCLFKTLLEADQVAAHAERFFLIVHNFYAWAQMRRQRVRRPVRSFYFHAVPAMKK